MTCEMGGRLKQLLHFWQKMCRAVAAFRALVCTMVWSENVLPALFWGLDQSRGCSVGAHLVCSGHQWACGMQVRLLPAQNYPPCDVCMWPPHLASGSHPGSCCLMHMLLHLSQSSGNWKLRDLPAQAGSSLHPPKLPCPEPMCRTSASMGGLKCQSNLPRLLISLNYHVCSSKWRFAWNSWPLLTCQFVQKWAVIAVSQHVLRVLILFAKHPAAKERAGSAGWVLLSRRRHVLNKKLYILTAVNLWAEVGNLNKKHCTEDWYLYQQNLVWQNPSFWLHPILHVLVKIQ